MTILSKQVYTYTAVRNVIVNKAQKAYVYGVASSLSNIEEYGIEGEIPTRIMSLYI